MSIIRAPNRRNTYLLVWGIAYITLAVSAVVGLDDAWILWSAVFGVGGIAALLSSLTPWPVFLAAGFTGLTAAAAIRACWHLIEWVTVPGGLRSHLPFAVLWSAVAAAQVVVAGWPVDKDE